MGEVEAPKRRGGRPPSRRRGTFAFRVTADLREKLQAEADRIGRPVSEVVESRLERSYLMDDVQAAIRQELRGVVRQVPVMLHDQPEPYINQSAPPVQ